MICCFKGLNSPAERYRGEGFKHTCRTKECTPLPASNVRFMFDNTGQEVALHKHVYSLAHHEVASSHLATRNLFDRIWIDSRNPLELDKSGVSFWAVAYARIISNYSDQIHGMQFLACISGSGSMDPVSNQGYRPQANHIFHLSGPPKAT